MFSWKPSSKGLKRILWTLEVFLAECSWGPTDNFSVSPDTLSDLSPEGGMEGSTLPAPEPDSLLPVLVHPCHPAARDSWCNCSFPCKRGCSCTRSKRDFENMDMSILDNMKTLGEQDFCWLPLPLEGTHGVPYVSCSMHSLILIR